MVRQEVEAVEEVVTEGDAKVAIYDDYEGEYDECPGEGYAEDCYQVAKPFLKPQQFGFLARSTSYGSIVKHFCYE